MTRRKRNLKAVLLACATVLLGSTGLRAAEEPPPDGGAANTQRTPPRLSFVDGSVSFWRPGAEDWAPAQVNTPLAPGDALYAAEGSNLEIQIGPRAYLRGSAGTQLNLENQEPNFLQFRVASGHVSFDLRSMTAGHAIEIDTPNAAFTLEHTGYYRVDVDGETTTFATRRGGYAAMTPAGGQVMGASPSEQVVIVGTDSPNVETYVAPELDSWDRWNYDRTDYLIDALSTRYVPPGVYGADALDHYGTWRVVGSYGPVWVPEGVAPTWAPYSTGRWIWDPYYGWTWVDTAPWGWAPYHYGRWVYVNDYWAWAPGPMVTTAVYAPGLVAFFGGGGFGVNVGFGVPPVGWVALGWGEPCVPWWGTPGFVGQPWWGGWGGPHVVNNTIINNTTIVNANTINIYRNVGVRDAVVAVPRDRFGRGATEAARLWNVDPHRLQPIHGTVPIKPSPAGLLPASGHGTRPPESILQRRVVSTRPLHDPTADLRSIGLKPGSSLRAPEPRLVPAPGHIRSPLGSPRPPFGPSAAPERVRPSLPPRFQENAPQDAAPQQEPGRAAGATRGRQGPPLLTNVGPHPQGTRGEASHSPSSTGAPPQVQQRVAPPQVQQRVAPPQVQQRVAPPQVQQRVAPPQAQPRGGPARSGPQHGQPPSAPVPQAQSPQAPARPLPGEPANRVYPGQGYGQPQRLEAPSRAPAVAPRGGGPHGGGAAGRERAPARQYGAR